LTRHPSRPPFGVVMKKSTELIWSAIPISERIYYCCGAWFGQAVRELNYQNIMAAGIIILIVLGGLLVLAVILAVFVIGIYNKLVTLRNRYKNAYAQIDVQLKRRYDLIPNLVETAKGYMKHESGTLIAVTEARNIAYAASKGAASNPGDVDAMAEKSIYMLENDERLNQFKDNALARAKEFDLSLILPVYESYYREVIEKSKQLA